MIVGGVLAWLGFYKYAAMTSAFPLLALGHVALYLTHMAQEHLAKAVKLVPPSIGEAGVGAGELRGVAQPSTHAPTSVFRILRRRRAGLRARGRC